MNRPGYPTPPRTGLLPLLLLACGLLAPRAQAAETVFQVEYKMELGRLVVGQVVRTLEQEGDDYTFRSELRPSGVAAPLFGNRHYREVSQWRRVDGELHPLRYHYLELNGGERVTVDVEFDWARGEVVDRLHAERWPLGAGVQDAASVYFRLMQAVASGEYAVELWVADPDHHDNHRHAYRVEGIEAGRTGLGEMEVVKVQELTEAKIAHQVWLAPGLGYLPVRVRQVVRGEPDITLTAVRIEVLDVAALLRSVAE